MPKNLPLRSRSPSLGQSPRSCDSIPINFISFADENVGKSIYKAPSPSRTHRPHITHSHCPKTFGGLPPVVAYMDTTSASSSSSSRFAAVAIVAAALLLLPVLSAADDWEEAHATFYGDETGAETMRKK